jgi:tetrahydromethanopterin S-methyltransferase subunit G
MAIERVGLHLGEHDRALAEMRGSRAVTQRLDELAARVDDLAGSGQSAAPGPRGSEGHSFARRSVEPDLEMRSLIRRLEDVEETAHAGREKLMNRLERMASSIDWRLQRLESGDPE